MSTLQGFVMVSQLTPISGDGSSPNQQFDCVPACLCAGSMYLKGITQVNAEWNPDVFLDSAYPEGYQGGTDARNYIAFCASRGVRLYEITGSPDQLIAETHQCLAKGSPAVLTILDPYVPASYGWTHAVVAFADSAGEITVLDPYIAKGVTHSDSEWSGLFRGNALWAMEAINMTIDITNPAVAAYFEQQDAQHWLCKNTNKVVQYAILEFYKGYGNAAFCGLTFLGLPVSNEIPLDAKGNVKQHYERGVVFYDPGHVYDNPPGSGVVYLAHLYSGPGVDPEVAQLQTELSKVTTPVMQGVDPTKVKNFQQAAGLQTHQLVQAAQNLEQFITATTL